MIDDPITIGLGVAATVGGSIAANQIAQNSVDEPDLPDPAEASRQAQQESNARQRSMAQFMARQRSLGPIQLRHPGLRI